MPEPTPIDRGSFVCFFAMQFLASYAASIYAEACAMDQHDRLKSLPVEDAFDIARDNWEAFMEQAQKEIGDE